MFLSCSQESDEKNVGGSGNGTLETKQILASDNCEGAFEFTVADVASDGEESFSDSELLSGGTVTVQKKIIKNGTLSIQSKNINESKIEIDKILKTLNAYYESEDLQNNDQTISFDLNIRVPSENFDQLLSLIENGKDEVKSKSIRVNDVTEEYVDIEGRLVTKREYLNRYKELLAKAATVKDVLEIEENIRVLQEEIESKEGRLKFLNDQVAFSTLNLNVFENKEFVYKGEPQDSFIERVKKSLGNGWNAIVSFVLWLISIWPFLLFVLISVWIFKRVIRKRRIKQA